MYVLTYFFFFFEIFFSFLKLFDNDMHFFNPFFIQRNSSVLLSCIRTGRT